MQVLRKRGTKERELEEDEKEGRGEYQRRRAHLLAMEIFVVTERESTAPCDRDFHHARERGDAPRNWKCLSRYRDDKDDGDNEGGREGEKWGDPRKRGKNQSEQEKKERKKEKEEEAFLLPLTHAHVGRRGRSSPLCGCRGEERHVPLLVMKFFSIARERER